MLVKTKHLTHRPLGDVGDLIDDNSTLFQVMAWCPPATSHYPIQCCPRSMLPHGITGSHWVNKYIVMSIIIDYTCPICYALGNLYAYITILICTVRMLMNIFWAVKCLCNRSLNISMRVDSFIQKGIEFHVLVPWVFVLVRLISSLPCATCRSPACPMFRAWISELYTKYYDNIIMQAPVHKNTCHVYIIDIGYG